MDKTTVSSASTVCIPRHILTERDYHPICPCGTSSAITWHSYSCHAQHIWQIVEARISGNHSVQCLLIIAELSV